MGVEGPKIPNNERPGDTSPVSVITVGRKDETSLVAATGEEKRKSPEELKAIKLKNLEKARATRMLYKKLDKEALERGEVPPSLSRKAEKDFPIIIGEDNKVEAFNVKDYLKDTKVSMTLPQLLYHAPELRYQYLHLLGGQPISNKKSSSTSNTDMDLDNEIFKNYKIQNINLDTTKLDLSPVKLQSVMACVGDTLNVEFLLDGGAVVSEIPIHVVRQLGKEEDMEPTNKTLRFGGDEIDIPIGTIKLKLKFSEQVVIYQSFCVTTNPNTPIILGIDFLLNTNSYQDPLMKTLTFRKYDGNEVETFEVETQDGEGMNTPVSIEEEQVVLPVLVTTSKKNGLTKDISIAYDWSFTPGDVQLLWINLQGEPDSWTGDMVLQPASRLFSSLGLYIVT